MKVHNQTAFCKSVTLRKEKHGDEKVAATSITIEGIRLDADVLDELCPISGIKFSEVLFTDKNPRLQQLFPLKLDTELEPYSVVINGLVMLHCTIKNLQMTPEVGRVVSLSLQVNTLLEDEFAAPLARAQQEDVEISIEPAQGDIENQQKRAA